MSVNTIPCDNCPCPGTCGLCTRDTVPPADDEALDCTCCECVAITLYWGVKPDDDVPQIRWDGDQVQSVFKGSTFKTYAGCIVIPAVNFDPATCSYTSELRWHNGWHSWPNPLLVVDPPGHEYFPDEPYGLPAPISLTLSGNSEYGGCTAHLLCDFLGVDEEFPLSTLSKCKKMEFEVPGGTLWLAGVRFHGTNDTNAPCGLRCCKSFACYEINVEVTASFDLREFHLGIITRTFALVIVLQDDSNLVGSVTADAQAILNAPSDHCFRYGSASAGERIPVDHPDVPVDSTGVSVTVTAVFYRDTLFVDTADSFNYIANIYTTTPHVPEHPCTDKDLSLAVEHRDPGDIGYDPGPTVTIDSIEMIKRPSSIGCPGDPCQDYPYCLLLFMPDVSNGTCDDCEAFVTPTVDGRFVPLELYRNRCSYRSDALLSSCVSLSGNFPQWVIAVDPDTSEWTAALVVFNALGGVDTAVGMLVRYSLVDTTLTFPKTLELVESSGECTDWPSYLVIRPCGGQERYGGCCQTPSSVGVSWCGETRAAECASVGGTWLGPGTMCQRNGCSNCNHHPDGPCGQFAAGYNLFIDSVTGDCAAAINTDPPNTPIEFVFVMASGSTCVYGMSGSHPHFNGGTIVIDKATDPPTWTMTLEGPIADGSLTVLTGRFSCDDVGRVTFFDILNTPGSICTNTVWLPGHVFLEPFQ